VLQGVGAGATIGTQDTWLDGYGVIAYFLVPLAFIPLVQTWHTTTKRRFARSSALR